MIVYYYDIDEPIEQGTEKIIQIEIPRIDLDYILKQKEKKEFVHINFGEEDGVDFHHDTIHLVN